MPGSARRRVAAANHSMPAVKMIFAGGYHVEEARERACTASTREEKERDLRQQDGSHRRKLIKETSNSTGRVPEVYDTDRKVPRNSP